MSRSLNRQPAPLNEEATQMLRDKGLQKYADVVASDGQWVGQALRLRHRTEDIDPDLKLYATYLEVTTVELGNNSFIPTDFVQDYDPENKRVTLSVPVGIVEDETWNRTPAFVASGKDRVEALEEHPEKA